MPLDHFSISVPQSKFEGLIAFLTVSLQHLGFKEHLRPVPTVVGLGDAFPFFWISGFEPEEGADKALENILKRQHIAFSAENIDQVKQFHAAALKFGGTCNGPPGLRTHYHPGYYGAFVLDPVCGLNFEVVCHKGVEESKTESGN